MVYRAYHKVLIPLLVFWIVGASFASTITVTDKLGRRISVNLPVKRAVMVITYELIPALQLWDQVVGVSRWAELNCGLYKAIIAEKPYLKKAEVGVGSDLNLEALLKLKPDLVITWTYHPDTIKFLESKGIPVIGIWPESLSELYEVMWMHGKLFNKEKRTKEVIEEMEKMFQFIKERVRKIPYSHRKKVIHLHGTPTRVTGGLGVTNDVINIVGAINPFAHISQNYIDVSVENIIKVNPDIIFIWGSAGYDESWLYNNSQWRFVKAIRNRQVYKLPRWSTWSPRLAPIALYMAMKTYPEAFKDVNLERELDRFYKKVFDISYYKVKEYEGF